MTLPKIRIQGYKSRDGEIYYKPQIRWMWIWWTVCVYYTDKKREGKKRYFDVSRRIEFTAGEGASVLWYSKDALERDLEQAVWGKAYRHMKRLRAKQYGKHNTQWP